MSDSEDDKSSISEVEAAVVEHDGLGNEGVRDLITQTDADGNSKPVKAKGTVAKTGKKDSVASLVCRVFCCLSVDCSLAPLLPDQSEEYVGKKSLILDLDETLVHSSFEMVEDPDFIVSVELKDATYDVYVIKRPGVDDFLNELSKHYELIIFTASLPKYAQKVLDQLDPKNVIEGALFRDSCTLHEGSYVKDLRDLGRDLKDTIIVDNSEFSYRFQPENAIGVSTFIDDKTDRELFYCKDFLLSLVDVDDVRTKLPTYKDFIAKQAMAEGRN
mmetsp:Transcript_13472/g.15364  ORF Transcript_13472/g.15364 Transcript_13472/m.15364 type:complete len:273 (-) Transcript_13472:311-1129(-)